MTDNILLSCVNRIFDGVISRSQQRNFWVSVINRKLQ
jgi:hypothetical protein